MDTSLLHYQIVIFKYQWNHYFVVRFTHKQDKKKMLKNDYGLMTMS